MRNKRKKRRVARAQRRMQEFVDRLNAPQYSAEAISSMVDALIAGSSLPNRYGRRYAPGLWVSAMARPLPAISGESGIVGTATYGPPASVSWREMLKP